MIVTNPFQEVKSQVLTVEVVTRYTGIEPKKSGSRWTGNCPLHDERTPSFYVFPDGGWKCFGCGEHGDSVDLVARLFGIRPLEAARKIADDFGIDLPSKKRRTKLSIKIAQEQREERELKAAFQQWERETGETLCLYYRCINKVLETYEDFMNKPDLAHALPLIEHYLNVLDYGTDEEKLELWGSGACERVLSCG